MKRDKQSITEDAWIIIAIVAIIIFFVFVNHVPEIPK